jgi:hypothetical protein
MISLKLFALLIPVPIHCFKQRCYSMLSVFYLYFFNFTSIRIQAKTKKNSKGPFCAPDVVRPGAHPCPPLVTPLACANGHNAHSNFLDEFRRLDGSKCSARQSARLLLASTVAMLIQILKKTFGA